MIQRYSWLLFDADGTILDYDAAEAYALKMALKDAGQTLDDDIHRLYRNINSSMWSLLEQGKISSIELRVERFRRLMEELGWSLDPSDLSRRYLASLSQAGHMISGAREMLDNLSPHFNKIIITNGIRDTQYGRLTRAGLIDDFQAIIISEDAGVAKPQKGFFDYALGVIGEDNRERMLVIGDSLSSDIAGGNAFGIDTCWFNPGRKPNTSDQHPTFEIAAWPDFFPIISSD